MSTRLGKVRLNCEDWFEPDDCCDEGPSEADMNPFDCVMFSKYESPPNKVEKIRKPKGGPDLCRDFLYTAAPKDLKYLGVWCLCVDHTYDEWEPRVKGIIKFLENTSQTKFKAWTAEGKGGVNWVGLEVPYYWRRCVPRLYFATFLFRYWRFWDVKVKTWDQFEEWIKKVYNEYWWEDIDAVKGLVDKYPNQLKGLILNFTKLKLPANPFVTWATNLEKKLGRPNLGDKFRKREWKVVLGLESFLWTLEGDSEDHWMNVYNLTKAQQTKLKDEGVYLLRNYGSCFSISCQPMDLWVNALEEDYK